MKRRLRRKSQSAAIATLMEAGIPVKQDTYSGLMHLNMTITDKAVVAAGSFNYSAAASTTNEVLVVIANAAIAQNWAQQFQCMWDDQAALKV